MQFLLSELTKRFDYFELVYFNLESDRIWCFRNKTDEGLGGWRMEEIEIFSSTLEDLEVKIREKFDIVKEEVRY